jgi:hypothetical protein
VIEKLVFDKEAAQICASERVIIVRAQAPRSEAQICCEADAIKNQFFNCVRYKRYIIGFLNKIFSSYFEFLVKSVCAKMRNFCMFLISFSISQLKEGINEIDLKVV